MSVAPKLMLQSESCIVHDAVESKLVLQSES